MKHKINTSSVLLQVLIRVRVRVTELVYQIGSTTFFRSRVGKYFKQQQAANKQQASNGAHFCLCTYLHQHRRDIAQTFMVDTLNDALQSQEFSGPNSARGSEGRWAKF